VPGETFRILLFIERIQNDFAYPLCFVHTRKIPF
jgi:hypothetical protein